jgi:integrase
MPTAKLTGLAALKEQEIEARVLAIYGVNEGAGEEVFSPPPSAQEVAARLLQEFERDIEGLRAASRAADEVVRANVFLLARERKEEVTIKAERDGLNCFMAYLREVGLKLQHHLADEPRLWGAVSHGLVEAFMRWEIWRKGYSIKTVKNHLSIVKLYARLAQQAGHMSAEQMLAISNIPTIRGKEARRIDELRRKKGVQTRFEHAKKAEATFLDPEELLLFLDRPATPQGLRDKVAILLMWDHSLRPSEALALTLGDLDLKWGRFKVDRHKTNDKQQLQFTTRFREALDAYLEVRRDRRPQAPLIVRSHRSGNLVEKIPRDPANKHSPRWTPPITPDALYKRIHQLGEELGRALGRQIDLASYDGRHGFVRQGLDRGIDPIKIKRAGNWKGMSMVERYDGEREIANEGIDFQ